MSTLLAIPQNLLPSTIQVAIRSYVAMKFLPRHSSPPQGLPGDEGDQGSVGEVGSQGPPGTQGPRGAPGKRVCDYCCVRK